LSVASFLLRGVGKKLIQAVCMKADEQQASQVYWLTQSHNTTARKLYDKLPMCPLLSNIRGDLRE